MIEQRLGAQLAAKVLGRIGGRASNGPGHFGHVDQNGLYAIAFALYLGLQTWHLVAIEDVRHTAVNVYGGHLAASFSFPLLPGIMLIWLIVLRVMMFLLGAASEIYWLCVAGNLLTWGLLLVCDLLSGFRSRSLILFFFIYVAAAVFTY